MSRSQNTVAAKFPNEQPLPSHQFVLHLQDCQGPIGTELNICTGLCTFNGPAYMFPSTPSATFSVYAGMLDSICEDVMFLAFIYCDRTPNAFEGEIRLYNVISRKKEISFEPMNTNQLEMTMTFNRRALFRCMFWSKLRDATEDEQVETTRTFADWEYKRLIQIFAENKRKALRKLNRSIHHRLWENCFPKFLREDGIFLHIQNHWNKEESREVPIDLSISACRVQGNYVEIAFITLPYNVGLMRFLERFATTNIQKMVGEFDNVLGVCQGQAVLRQQSSGFICKGDPQNESEQVYRLRLHTKWHTSLDLEVLAEDYFIMHHRMKGIRVMQNEMRFCPTSSAGIIFPENVVPKNFLPEEYEHVLLEDRRAIRCEFPKVGQTQEITKVILPSKAVLHRKISVARISTNNMMEKR